MLRLAFDFIITWRETRTRPNAYFLSVKHVRLREPVFLFLACLTVPWPYPQGLAKENTAAKRG